jgi:hypothetical protein
MYRGYFDDLRWNLIEAFFNTHKGRGDSFLLPSWRAETKLITPYVSGVGLDIANTIFFSSITGKPGNLLYIKYPWQDMGSYLYGGGFPIGRLGEGPLGEGPLGGVNIGEVRQVATVENDTHLHLVSGFDNAYPLDSIVQVAYRVRFGADKLPPLKYMGFDTYEVELTMQEDI